MSDYKQMSKQQLVDFIGVTEIAMRRAGERNDQAVVDIAQQDIADAARELRHRA